MKKAASGQLSKQAETSVYTIEAEVVPGLERLAAREIASLFGKDARIVLESEQRLGAVRFNYRGSLYKLDELYVTQAIYIVDWFDIPRPKALLGNTEFRIIADTLRAVIGLAPNSYKTFHLSAAGSDSSVMRRFAEAIAQRTQLAEDDQVGDLWLRIRRGVRQRGWEVLTRIGNRPLATRDWRICNFEGALNATVAHGMALLSGPHLHDVVVNMGCGSGSLLIERGLWGNAKQLIGVDWDQYALMCARQNLAAARLDAVLIHADITHMPLAPDTADVILADLPFGRLSGSHTGNKVLYPLMLAEAARIARSDAHMIVITHELRLMQASLAESSQWNLQQDFQITLRGLHPRIYVLKRV